MTENNSIVPQKKSALMAKIIQQLKSTPIIQIGCERAGVSRSTYYRWRQENKKFASRCDESLEEGYQLVNDLAEAKLLTSIKDGNLTGIFYWLNHRHKAYANRLEVSGGLEIKKDELTKEQETDILRALELASLVVKKNNKKGDCNEKSKK
jgi:phosphoribosylformylglycinamidine (FGAM) synthase-like enzyme